MIVDCRTCPVRGQGCDDCIVTVLLGAPGSVDSPWAPACETPACETPACETPACETPACETPACETPGELALDAAESRVVSIFVGAGLVRPAAVAGLRARRESVQSWGAVQNVG